VTVESAVAVSSLRRRFFRTTSRGDERWHLNGGPEFKHSEAFSFLIVTDNQAETDRYWNAIVNNGGTENACGWCKDKWGLSWQITPRALLDATTDPDREAAKRPSPEKRVREKPESGGKYLQLHN
jgi:predicted 3-demethylubiquinone-9 3-methyltransferase (glyoxalase superfamily)